MNESDSIFGGETAEDREIKRKRLSETRKNSLAQVKMLLEKVKIEEENFQCKQCERNTCKCGGTMDNCNCDNCKCNCIECDCINCNCEGCK